MPTIITAFEDENGKQGFEIHNPDYGSVIGRWCAPPLVPELCARCFDPKTLGHYPAEGYREERERIKRKAKIWRHGYCHRCLHAQHLDFSLANFVAVTPAEIEASRQAEIERLKKHDPKLARWMGIL